MEKFNFVKYDTMFKGEETILGTFSIGPAILNVTKNSYSNINPEKECDEVAEFHHY